MASIVTSAAGDNPTLGVDGRDAPSVETAASAPVEAATSEQGILEGAAAKRAAAVPPPLPSTAFGAKLEARLANIQDPVGIDLTLELAPAADASARTDSHAAASGTSVPPPLPSTSHAPPPLGDAADMPLPAAGSVLAAALQPPPPPDHATPPPHPTEAPADLEHESLLSAIWTQMPSWLASTVVHLTLLVLLALGSGMELPQYGSDAGGTVAETGTFNGGSGPKDEGDRLDATPTQTQAIQPDLTAEDLKTGPQSSVLDSRVVDNALMPTVPNLDIALGGGLGMVSGGTLSGMPGDGHDLLQGAGDPIGLSLRNRLNAGSRARLVASGGGTPGSEAAVERALKWLAEHQNIDGSWSYDHRICPKCKGRCKNPGNLPQSNVAATAMALLPFLGTGETHHQGKYKRNIEAGLYYLTRVQKLEQDRGDLWEQGGRMYGHGLASIAVLCEAYGMTHDRWLHDPAQKAINYIIWAQDPQFGGWRYTPHMAGDTSIVGWQVMALKSAHMAYLKVPPGTIQRAGYFLDSVQTADGAYYGYTGPGNGPATSAIGLLCRMYMGWERNNPSLAQGVEALVRLGPSLDKTGPPRNNMYFNYYATQVMHHWGGSDWQRWNVAMRDYLIQSQFEQGHSRGSWFFEGSDHGLAAGGRLYCTAMATMILEVYYRHMPLYTDLSTKDKFRD